MFFVDFYCHKKKWAAKLTRRYFHVLCIAMVIMSYGFLLTNSTSINRGVTTGHIAYENDGSNFALVKELIEQGFKKAYPLWPRIVRRAIKNEMKYSTSRRTVSVLIRYQVSLQRLRRIPRDDSEFIFLLSSKARVQYLSLDHQDQFQPVERNHQAKSSLFQEAVIV